MLSRGAYTTFDAPGVPITLPFGINNRGQIVGVASAGPGTYGHGFLLAKGGEGPFTPIAVPGALGTGATGINDRGQIVGLYATPDAAPNAQGTHAAADDDDVGP